MCEVLEGCLTDLYRLIRPKCLEPRSSRSQSSRLSAFGLRILGVAQKIGVSCGQQSVAIQARLGPLIPRLPANSIHQVLGMAGPQRLVQLLANDFDQLINGGSIALQFAGAAYPLEDRVELLLRN